MYSLWGGCGLCLGGMFRARVWQVTEVIECCSACGMWKSANALTFERYCVQEVFAYWEIFNFYAYS